MTAPPSLPSFTEGGNYKIGEHGFTLFEVLVAFVIATLVLAVFYRSTLTGLSSMRLASTYEEAIARANSHLEALDGAPLVASDRQGDEGNGFHWHVRIAPAAAVDPARRRGGTFPARLVLYTVSVSISWGPSSHPRQISLATSRLGPAS